MATSASRSRSSDPVWAAAFNAMPTLAATAPVDRPAVATPVGLAPSTSDAAVTGDITIFAATSLTEVLGALGAAFTKANPNAHPIFFFANSATLADELVQGAKADV